MSIYKKTLRKTRKKAFANPNYGNGRIGDISSNVLNMCLKLDDTAIDDDARPIPLSSSGYELLEEDGGSSEIEWLAHGQCAGDAVEEIFTDDCTEFDKSMADLRVALIKTLDPNNFIDSLSKAKAVCAAYGMYPAYSDVGMIPKGGDDPSDPYEYGTLYRIYRKWMKKYEHLGSAVQIVNGIQHVSYIGWVLGVDTDPDLDLTSIKGSRPRVMGTKKQMFGPAHGAIGNIEEIGGFGSECCEGGTGLDGCGKWKEINDGWVSKTENAGLIMDMINWIPPSDHPACKWFINEFSYRAIMCASREEGTPNCASMELCKNAMETKVDLEADPSSWEEVDGEWCCGGFLPDNQYTRVDFDHPDVLNREYNQQVCDNVDPCAQDPGPCVGGECIPVTSDNYLLSDQLQMPKEHSPHYTCKCPSGTKLQKQMTPFEITYDDGTFTKQITLGSAYECVDVPDCEFTTCADHGTVCVDDPYGTYCECPGTGAIALWDDATNAWVCPDPPGSYCEELEKERMPPGFRRVWPTSWNGLADVSGYPDDTLETGSSWRSMWVSPMWDDKDAANQDVVKIDFIGDRKVKQWTLADGSVKYEVDNLFDDDADTFFEFDHFNQTYQASETPDNGDFQLQFGFYEFEDDSKPTKRMLFDRLEITLHQSTMNRLQYGGVPDTADLTYRGSKIKFGHDSIYAKVNDDGSNYEWYLEGGATSDHPNTFVISAGSGNHSIITDRVTLVITDPAIRIAEIKFHFFDCESLDIKQYANPNYVLGTVHDMSSFGHSMCGEFPVTTVDGKEIATSLDSVDAVVAAEHSNFGGDPNLVIELMGYKYSVIYNTGTTVDRFTFNTMSEIEDVCARYGMFPPFGSGYESAEHGIGQAYDTLKAEATAFGYDMKVFLGIKSDGAGSLAL
ncbi:unnamed protein product, partial [Oikopleura dioica]